MTHLSVILCETEPRWAPALRVAFVRAAPQLDAHKSFQIVIREARTLGELRRSVQQWPNSLLGVEIERSSVGEILSAVPPLLERFPQSRAVALLNRAPADLNRAPARPDSENRLIAVLHEAGFLEAALSPRRLAGVVEICRRFAERRSSGGKNSLGKCDYCEQVRSALPWQPAMPPVG